MCGDVSIEERSVWPQRRGARPSWWVIVGGERVGWVEEVPLRGARRVFYRAIGIHPLDGGEVVLELSTDREERAQVVAMFRADPMRYAQHLPRKYRFDQRTMLRG